MTLRCEAEAAETAKEVEPPQEVQKKPWEARESNFMHATMATILGRQRLAHLHLQVSKATESGWAGFGKMSMVFRGIPWSKVPGCSKVPGYDV